jgi:hypothetical protein
LAVSVILQVGPEDVLHPLQELKFVPPAVAGAVSVIAVPVP